MYLSTAVGHILNCCHKQDSSYASSSIGVQENMPLKHMTTNLYYIYSFHWDLVKVIGKAARS